MINVTLINSAKYRSKALYLKADASLLFESN